MAAMFTASGAILAWSLSSRVTRRALTLLLLSLLGISVHADCECGYAVTDDRGDSRHVFTDLIESDFAALPDISINTDWARQAFNMTATTARGKFGEMFTVEDVSTSTHSGTANTGVGAANNVEDAGLQLVVRATQVDDMIPAAEIDTTRLDVWWGTFRASMKLTAVSGTCAAFFWYYNDTEEIDMEFLSKDFRPSNNSYPVNLVLQSRQSVQSGYNAQMTGNFVKAYLPFDPTTDFHEYRFDLLPGRVLFYADDKLLAQMNGSAVPTDAGHLVLQHWSNGNPLWSGGPPVKDAVMNVKYVKAYFNSSRVGRIGDWARRCKDPSALGAVCSIPSISASDSNATNWFFSGQANMTNNQTVSGQQNTGSSPGEPWCLLHALLLLVGGWAAGVW
ncbi:Glycoside hydrolase, family 16 [Pleurostoma richardsiae]|uniref:Glycoside hydrolase, family 16 n=1 Tax=Pleurostoma richardsiae TaxID=41990 RepID=A0AA38VV20_9PEZI|nr:Glycoside hydrolase, family 16 [Pleurostoma richardsiae]